MQRILRAEYTAHDEYGCHENLELSSLEPKDASLCSQYSKNWQPINTAYNEYGYNVHTITMSRFLCIKIIDNKKVPLRECKRHTDHHIANTRCAAGDGGYLPWTVGVPTLDGVPTFGSYPPVSWKVGTPPPCQLAGR